MTLAQSTGRAKDRKCVVCGGLQRHVETVVGPLVWWRCVPHVARCGAACFGGGVRPAPSAGMGEVFDALASCHRKAGCGVADCKGGTSP